MQKDRFIEYLCSEFERRKKVNPRYSLRSYANFLGVYHGTLSGILSGKRKISDRIKKRLIKIVDPEGLNGFLYNDLDALPHLVLSSEASEKVCDWYFDAILELSRIGKAPLTAKKAAAYLGLPASTITKAIEILTDYGLLKQISGGYKLVYQYTTTLTNNEQTSELRRKHQKSILALSSQSVDRIQRKWRDHTSTCLAIRKEDVPQAKEIIRNFRHQLAGFLQTNKDNFDELYQLQVSFFPLNREVSNDLQVTT